MYPLLRSIGSRTKNFQPCGLQLFLLLAISAMGLTRWHRDFRVFSRATTGGLVPDFDLALSAFLDRKTKKLRKLAAYSQSAAQRALAKRHARANRTAFLRQFDSNRDRRRKPIKHVDVLLYRPVENRLRDTLAPNFMKDWKDISSRIRDRRVKQIDFSNLSLAKNPNETLKKLADLANACSVFPEVRLNFLDSTCDDVASYIVLAHLHSALPPIITGGRIHEEVRKVISAVRLRQALGIGAIGGVRRRKRNRGFTERRRKAIEGVSAFELVTRSSPQRFSDRHHQIKPQRKEQVGDSFCSTLNGWLGEYQLSLTPEAEQSLVTAIGEALDNAERHGAADTGSAMGDWSVAGFSRLCEEDGRQILRCSMGMVNIGTTISNSLFSAAPSVKSKIDSYVARHTPIFGSGMQPELLRTVMALQDGITRVSDATRDRRGGKGFMELAQAFAELGDNGISSMPSVFTIISGRSCVQFTGRFRQGMRDAATRRREMWFNDDNDPSKPPSEAHAFTLDKEFPGTILSASFVIDPTYLRKRLSV